MPNIHVSHDIKLSLVDLPTPLREQIVDDLTLDNPKFIQSERMGYSTWDIPVTIPLHRVDKGSLSLPRGYMHNLVALLNQHAISYAINDERLRLPDVEYNSTIQLRQYQVAAVDALIANHQGGVCASCGSGKTMIGLAAIARTNQPAMWITHTKELADQVIERAVSVFGMRKDEIGYIGGGKYTIGTRLTVALVQTLSKRDLADVVDKFGCVCIDEAHHMGASSFFSVINQFPAAYRFWLPATPTRSVGLTHMVVFRGWPIVHQIHQSEVPTITPCLVAMETQYDYMCDSFAHQMSNLIANRLRNELICTTIAKHAKGNYSLVLSDRLDHLKTLRGMLRERLPHMTIEILHGQLPKREREELMQRIRNKQVDIALSTQLAREGLDIPHLNQLFLTTPKRAIATVQQEIGRVMRPCEGKTSAVVFDFVDSRNPVLRAQWKSRGQVYGQLGIKLA